MTDPLYMFHLTQGTKDISIKSLTVNGGATFNSVVTFGAANFASAVTFNGATQFNAAATFASNVNFGTAQFASAATFNGTVNFGTGTVGKVIRNSDGAGSFSWGWAQGSYVTKTDTDYTILDTDGYDIILVSTGNTNRTITLPTAADNAGRTLFIKKTDSGTGKVIVDGEGSETIDGKTTIDLSSQYDFLKIISDSSNWIILSKTEEYQQIKVETANGYGSTNNKIRRFSTEVLNTGSSLIAYSDSSTGGGAFTANKKCKVFVVYADNTGGSGSHMGLSLNSNQLTTAIDAITSSHAVSRCQYGFLANLSTICQWSGIMDINDVLRCHTEGVAAGNNSRTTVYLLANTIN